MWESVINQPADQEVFYRELSLFLDGPLKRVGKQLRLRVGEVQGPGEREKLNQRLLHKLFIQFGHGDKIVQPII